MANYTSAGSPGESRTSSVPAVLLLELIFKGKAWRRERNDTGNGGRVEFVEQKSQIYATMSHFLRKMHPVQYKKCTVSLCSSLVVSKLANCAPGHEGATLPKIMITKATVTGKDYNKEISPKINLSPRIRWKKIVESYKTHTTFSQSSLYRFNQYI